MLGQPEGGERGGGRWFRDDGIPGGERRRDLVAEQVQRKVERPDGDDDPDRVADREEEPVLVPGRAFVGVRGKALSSQVTDLLGGEEEDPGGTVGLDPGVDDRFPDLGRDQTGHRLAVGLEPGGGRPQDPGPFVARHFRPAVLGVGGRIDGRSRLVGGRDRRLADHATGRRVPDRRVLAARGCAPTAADEERAFATRGDAFCHGPPTPGRRT